MEQSHLTFEQHYQNYVRIVQPLQDQIEGCSTSFRRLCNEWRHQVMEDSTDEAAAFYIYKEIPSILGPLLSGRESINEANEVVRGEDLQARVSKAMKLVNSLKDEGLLHPNIANPDVLAETGKLEAELRRQIALVRQEVGKEAPSREKAPRQHNLRSKWGFVAEYHLFLAY
jgi:hypothetical protein